MTLQELEEGRHQSAVKHGFAYKAPREFRDCLVVRWRYGTHPEPSWYRKVAQYHDLVREIVGETLARDKSMQEVLRSSLLASELLHLAGIYNSESFVRTWAIPDRYPKIQKLVLSLLPPWARAVHKSSTHRNKPWQRAKRPHPRKRATRSNRATSSPAT